MPVPPRDQLALGEVIVLFMPARAVVKMAT